MTIASVRQQDDTAPPTPMGEFRVATARAEGAGFPAVTAADAVAEQATVSGVFLRGIAAPDGSRFADVDAEDDAAPADPRGLYPLAVARAAGGGAGVIAGDAVALGAGTGGVLYTNPASADLARVADVITEDAIAPLDPTGQVPMAVAAAAGSGAGVANLDNVAVRASTGGVLYSLPASADLARVADVVTEDAVAPADPTGLFANMMTARAEGAGFPAVVAGDNVTPQGTVSGVPLLGLAAPDGSRFADVDAEDDAAPADPRGLYPLAVARAAGGGAGVIAGDAVALGAGTGGVLYTNPASADLARIADVVTEDAVAPADPTGLFSMLTARAEGVGFPAVVGGDNVTPQGTVSGVPLVALSAPDGTAFCDADAENDPAPAAPRGIYVGGRATTASPAFTTGDYTDLNFDTSGRLRTVEAAAGADAIHTSATSGALGAGANTVTVATITAGKRGVLKQIIATYTGTVTGVTMQLLVGGVAADLPVNAAASGQYVRLLAAGVEIDADAAETIQIQVEGATATDTISYRAHHLELTTA